MEHHLTLPSPDNPNSHLTAKEREGPSFPARKLVERRLPAGRILDFGCGLGADVAFLAARGLDVTGYDPHYAPEPPTGRYDTIVCLYVLNVLLPEEQSHVLMAVSELLRPGGAAYFAVRRDVKRAGFRTHAKHGVPVYQCNVVLPYPSILRNEFCEIYEYRHINQLRRDGAGGCPYCAPHPEWELLSESAQAYAVLDPAAPSPGACLIIPKRHTAGYFDLPTRVKTACWLLADRVKGLLDARFHPAGYTLTVDTGAAAGQEVDHAHIRLTPRYAPDAG